ncbi:MAG: 4-hydroxy-tetrahydrodipicolinate synthase [Chlamydiia bacterium]|nr:4-hydroxy-tetrahydrodipicolinate synthase [Chlamydiia bacterium]
MSFGKVITALITPFKGERVDIEGLKDNISFQIEAEVDGLLFLGSTGEGNSLSSDEREEVMEVAVQEGKGKIPILFSVGGLSTKEVIEKVKIAEDKGGDVLLITPPYYLLPSQEGMIAHFEAIAEKTSVPIILYNHPKRTGVHLEVETVKRLASLKNIVGIKDASGQLGYSVAIRDALPHFELYAGDDLFSLPLLAIGGSGVISVLSNLMPQEMKKMVLEKEPTLYQKLYPFMKMSQIETNPVPIKAMMNFANLPAGECRLPLTPLTPSSQCQIEELLKKSFIAPMATHD